MGKGVKKPQSPTQFLEKQALFSTLSPRELRVVERLIHSRSYFPGEIIFKPGSSIGMYMILKGSVDIFFETDQEQRPLSRLGEGDFLGELSLIQEKGYQKTFAKAAEPTELLGFFRPEMMSLIEKYPKIGVKILIQMAGILGSRLQKAGEALAQIPNQAARS